MKKQILIVMTGAMDLGGIEKSLLGLLDAFDYSKVDVDLFLYGHHGILLEQINKNVNILPEVKELAYLRESIFMKIKNGCWYSVWRRIYDAIASCIRTVDHDETWAEIMRKSASRMEKHYDLALSFFLPYDFIHEKVDAKVKLGWIHTDYRKHCFIRQSLEKQFQMVDRIVTVSEECKQGFIEIFPTSSGKTIVIENILSKKNILRLANAFSVENEMQGVLKLLSIGRFSPAKNFENIPVICKLLRDRGLDVNWYIIGYGENKDKITASISDNSMEDYVHILGKKENPYPYIKSCHLYVQPSIYEGKCVAVREAQLLGKPVVITNYPTADGQIKNGFDGIIVPLDNEKCAETIAQLLQSPNELNKIASNCMKNDYANKNEINKLYSYLI